MIKMNSSKMRIKIIEGDNKLYVNWIFENRKITTFEQFQFKDGGRATEIVIGKAGKYWKMGACHEIAHLYVAKKFKMSELEIGYNKHPSRVPKKIAIKVFRNELAAWRVAKSFCNRIYWNEKHALLSLSTFCIYKNLPYINFKKLKIIPLYKI
jgi:hypothetical protein